MLATILTAFKVADIRKKLAVTALLLALYRLGAHIPVPGVNVEALKAKGLGTRKDVAVKILAKGAISKPLSVHAHKFSAAAREAIEAAGGTCHTVAD